MQTRVSFSSLIALAIIATAHGAFDPVQFGDTGHYYQFMPSLRTWTDARAAAEQMGGYLAVATSPEENAFLTSLVPLGQNAWLGGFQTAGSAEPSGGWQWVTGEPFAYANWNGGEPNNGTGWVPWDESVIELYGMTTSLSGTWNDMNPEKAYYAWLVEYNTQPSGLPEPPGPEVVVPEPSTLFAGMFLLLPFLVGLLRQCRLGRRRQRGPWNSRGLILEPVRAGESR